MYRISVCRNFILTIASQRRFHDATRERTHNGPRNIVMKPNTLRTIAVAALLALTVGCSSFFKMSPEGATVLPPPKVVPPTIEKESKKVPAPAPSMPKVTVPKVTTPKANVKKLEAKRVDEPKPVLAAPSTAPIVVSLPEPEPAPVASDSSGVARLATLAAVWQAVALFHPAVIYRSAAWDSALVRAIPIIRSARDVDRLEIAYISLLSVLGDSATRVERDTLSRTLRAGSVRATRTVDSVLVLQLPADATFDADDAATISAALAQLPTRVVVDLRMTERARDSDADRVNAFVEQTGLARALTPVSLPAPAERVRRVGGVLQDSVDDTRVRFGGAWIRRDVPLVRAAATAPHRVLVLANRESVIPRGLAALLSAGRATLVGDGALDDESLVSSVRITVAPGLSVRVRTGELVHPDGTFGLLVDTVMPRSKMLSDSTALRAALTIVRAVRMPRALHLPGVAFTPALLPAAFDTASYPLMGARVLAGFRLWSAMRSRHAHRDQYDDDADAVFVRILPRLEAARDALQYVAAISDLAATFDDAQSTVSGPWRETLLGTSSAPFRARVAEGRAILTDVVRDSSTLALGLTVGTEIVAADGFPFAAWLSEHRRVASASNDWTRTRDLMRVLPRGPEGSALFKVRDVAGKERTVYIPRRATYAALVPREERADAIAARRLTTSILYLDLERLNARAIDSAFAAAAGSRAVVLDLRGTLRADAATILRHVAQQPRFIAYRALSRVASAPCLAPTLREAATLCSEERTERMVWFAVDTSGRFRGRVYALIDERTQGAAERAALALESGANAVFIGSPSAGAAAIAVSLELPGWLTVGVPAVEIRRADGGLVHRVGITPTVDVRLTVRGIRGGQDDVLERAQQFVVQQLEPTPVRRRR